MTLHPNSMLGLTLGAFALIALLLSFAYPIYRVFAVRMEYRYGKLKAWRDWHIVISIAFLCFMILHSGFALPDDLLTGAVFYLSLLVGTGGGVWWLAQTIVPRKLARLKEHVLLERIPETHKHLLTQGEELTKETSTTLARWYRDMWLPEMQRFEFSISHFFNVPVDALARPMASIKTLLRSEEHETLIELHRIYFAKQELEVTYSLQLALKYFHLAHGPVAFILLVLVLVHALSILIF